MIHRQIWHRHDADRTEVSVAYHMDGDEPEVLSAIEMSGDHVILSDDEWETLHLDLADQHSILRIA